MKKEDRRVRMTKKVIRDSLVELMQELPIQKISVRMICESADINRSTFYAHYKDQYDLLTNIQGDIIKEVKEKIFPTLLISDEKSFLVRLTQLLEYGRDNAALLRVLLYDNNESFQVDLIEIVQRKMLEELPDEDISMRARQYCERFVLDGFLGVIRRWLDEGCIDEPEVLAQLMINLMVRGASGLLMKQ